ncbi:hypothetical protein O7626_36570 [Micromonospora sp. WMMD1102]|uniref:hypothetical protein n=1 Tax=Micromonospora sp. WMMD1102 TaxID=3016105 RepID=UPI0024156FCC|nr:hypothetical protein [Micromonospora sp. WMMD1102]MDG4791348.1 hypothetical protein [Micromonospora sp. WMMD1102]
MRLTVGPLPPTVYWRRRAVVLGAVLLFLVVVLYSCLNTGGPDNGKGKGADPGPSPTLTPHIDPSASGPAQSGGPDPGGPGGGAEPGGGEPSDGPPDDGGGDTVEPVGGGQVPPAPPPVDNECTDQEMSVVPVPSRASAQRGQPIELRLRIKNVSGRTCNRDVGADLQELYIKSGARKVWSSDACSLVRSNDVRPFPPSHENEYTISWNGRESSKCANQLAAGPYPAAGTYQLFGRLGDKHSEPVRINITG